MNPKEKLLNNELTILKEEEKTLKNLIDQYQNNLNALKVEELTLINKLGHDQDRERSSRNITPLFGSGENDPPIVIGSQEIIMNELQINQSALNLTAVPLIHRMLQDQFAYEEEEEDDMNT